MKRKNILVLMSDEHDPRHMGCSGSPIVKTPNLDALAARGTRFCNAYTPSPICVPARAAFATGRRVHQVRLWDNASPYHGQSEGWGHVLQRHRIRTESIGKLHYRQAGDLAGFDVEHIPMHVVGGYGMVWASIRDPYLTVQSGQRMLGEHIGRGESAYTRYDEEVTDRAVGWLRRAGENKDSFVLYVGLVAPHFPLIAPPRFYDMYEELDLPESKLLPERGYDRHPWVQQYADFGRIEESFADREERRKAMAAYFGLCSFLDHNVGRILTALTDAGLSESTTVIYTSDHGDNLGARGLWGKSTLYQESVMVPLITTGFGTAGSVCETPVDLLDLFPTIIRGAGLNEKPLLKDRPGVALQDIATQATNPDRLIFSEYHAAGSNTAAFMIRKGPWKYHYYVRHRPELFDLTQDPEELHDVAEDPRYAEVVEAMHEDLLDICDPEAMDLLCKQDQSRMIEDFGGVTKASQMGANGATPAPTA